MRVPGMTYVKRNLQELDSVSYRQLVAFSIMSDEVDYCMRLRGKACLDLRVPEDHVLLRLYASQMSFLCED